MQAFIEKTTLLSIDSTTLILLYTFYFVLKCVETFDIRVTQHNSGLFSSHAGRLAEGRHIPVAVGLVHYLTILIFLVLLILNWFWSAILLAAIFALKVLPVMETLGALFVLPFMRRERLEAEDCFEFALTRAGDEALFWYRKAAEMGHPFAQHELGRSYLFSDLERRDLEKAYYWFEKAARGGVVEAQLQIADFFELGVGVRQNTEKAIYWYRKAAEQGSDRGALRAESLQEDLDDDSDELR